MSIPTHFDRHDAAGPGTFQNPDQLEVAPGRQREGLEGWIPELADETELREALEKAFDGGATEVHIHSGQPDQRRVIEFYGKEVLPRFRKAHIGKAA